MKDVDLRLVPERRLKIVTIEPVNIITLIEKAYQIHFPEDMEFVGLAVGSGVLTGQIRMIFTSKEWPGLPSGTTPVEEIKI
jgi:hypothetical protein